MSGKSHYCFEENCHCAHPGCDVRACDECLPKCWCAHNHGRFCEDHRVETDLDGTLIEKVSMCQQCHAEITAVPNIAGQVAA